MSAKKIIFLEDNSTLARLYISKLEQAGFEVKLFETADALLEAAPEFKPDLAFLDHALHGDSKSGFDVIKPLKDLNEGIKIVMLSNYSKFQMERATKEAGAMDYLVKLNTPPTELVKYAKSVLR